MENRKTKKRTSKKNHLFGNWVNSGQCDQSNEGMSIMECPQVLWQPGMQPHVQNQNGQRLFAAMSDPSVCGYSLMPMTYTMEPVSLPAMYRLYQPMPYGVQTTQGRPRQKFHPNPPVIPNGYTSLQENKTNSTVLSSYQNGDYASLPPVANKSNGVNKDELSSEHRRYSDPGLGPTELPVLNQGEDSDSADSGSSITTIGRSNKLVLSLIEQMAELKRSNGQLFKELSEAKVELQSMKIKLSEYKHSSDYQPGMVSDLIREIRDVRKMCEQELLTKTQSLVEEKHSQTSEEISVLKSQMLKLVKEKEECERRVSKLEHEVTGLHSTANNLKHTLATVEDDMMLLKYNLQKRLGETNQLDETEHGTKLEKPMDDLRKMAEGNTNDDDGDGGSVDDFERVSSASSTSAYRPSIVYPSYDVVSSGKGCRSSKEASSSLSSATSNVRNESEVEEDDENELDEGQGTSRSSRQDFVPSRTDYKVTKIHDSSMNLSGPVTDL